MSEDLAAPSPASNATSNATPAHSPQSSTTDQPQGLSSSRPSISRAINPAPAPARVTPKIATASSPPLDYPTPSPVGGGPTSGSYVVPPRPKPGRKPATDEPASKRKAQNRESQRAFRARKAAKLTEMQSQVETAQQQHRRELMSKEGELNDSLSRIRLLEAELVKAQEQAKRATQECDYWKDKANQQEDLVRQLKDRDNSATNAWPGKTVSIFPTTMSHSRQDSPTRESLSAFTPLTTTPQAYGTPKTLDMGCGNCKANGECACAEEIAKFEAASNFMPAIPLSHAPPRTTSSPMKGVQVVHGFEEREIDFTAMFSTKKPRVDNRPSIPFLTQAHEPCGFCTDESNCLCRDQSLQMNNEMSNSVRTPGTTTEPGSCEDCMRDPKQRAWCQRVAQLKRSETDYFGRSPVSRASSMSSALDPMEPRIDPGPADSRHSIGCSEAYRLLDGRVPTDRDDMDWSGLNPHSPSMRKDTLPAIDPRRKYSALELDTAGVIATLQQTILPLNPRKEDGPHANLVRIAQEHQRHSSSPQVGSDGWR